MSAEGSSVKGSSQQSSTSGPKVKGGGLLFSGQGPLITGGLVNDTTVHQCIHTCDLLAVNYCVNFSIQAIMINEYTTHFLTFSFVFFIFLLYKSNIYYETYLKFTLASYVQCTFNQVLMKFN